MYLSPWVLQIIVPPNENLIHVFLFNILILFLSILLFQLNMTWGFSYNIALAGNIWCFVSKDYQWSHSVVSDTWRPNSPGWNTGVDRYSFLQGIFPTQGWNPGLPHCRRILYQLSQKGSPRILEWVAYPFPRGHSQLRSNWGLLHWRRILYQLSYQGIPHFIYTLW